MALTLPAFSYPADLPGAPMQCIGNADRPVCAATAALAALLRGATLGGAAKKLREEQVHNSLYDGLKGRGVPPARALLWAKAVNGLRIGPMPVQDLAGKTLSQYQCTSAGMLSRAGGVLALGVGLGKTLTALLAAKWAATCADGASSRLWIICPLSAMFDAWEPYREWAEVYFAEVKIISMDSAHKLMGADKRLGGVVIFDEAHLVGRMTARRTKAAHEIRTAFDFGLCLTGTLLHGGVEKAMTVLDLAVPGAAQFATKWRAGEYFGCLEKNHFGCGLGQPTGKHAKAFHNYLARFVVSLTKDDPQVKNELTIPEQQLHDVVMGGAENEALDDCLIRIAKAQMQANPGVIPEAAATMHAALAEGAEAKLAWVLEQMDDPTIGVAVFAEYHTTLDLARKTLEDNGISFAYVDGSITGEARAEECRKFQAGEVQVFLGQIDASGTAVNLYRGFVSVTLDLTMKATNYAQMLGRTCRRGQTHECHHFDVVANALQLLCLRRLRAAEDFHREFTTYARQVLGGLT